VAEPTQPTQDLPHHYTPASWPLPLRARAGVSRFLAVLEGIGIGACLVGVIFFAIWQCIDRNLSVRHLPSLHAPDWTHGLIRHSVFMLGFLGGAYATYTGRHIRIDAITRVVKERRRMLLRVFTTLAAIYVVVLLTKAALAFYGATLEENAEASQAHELFTPARGTLIIIAGYIVIAYHFAIQVLLDIAWLISGKDPPPHWIAEASAHGGEVPAGDAGHAAPIEEGEI
jgi:TRAP-type C4-dicarboxylate transport system permease small subunit